mmetsp:Transcript_13613/g.22451  ORF Transcript_13613/g.22451 Transcript_13613/m.22451 type:complete len:113 (-) Transcript_13613:59-397(-)
MIYHVMQCEALSPQSFRTIVLNGVCDFANVLGMMVVTYYASCLHFTYIKQVFCVVSLHICFQSLYCFFYLPLADVSCIGHELDIPCLMFPLYKERNSMRRTCSFCSGARCTA